jgi:hypothetical protein
MRAISLQKTHDSYKLQKGEEKSNKNKSKLEFQWSDIIWDGLTIKNPNLVEDDNAMLKAARCRIDAVAVQQSSTKTREH